MSRRLQTARFGFRDSTCRRCSSSMRTESDQRRTRRSIFRATIRTAIRTPRDSNQNVGGVEKAFVTLERLDDQKEPDGISFRVCLRQSYESCRDEERRGGGHARGPRSVRRDRRVERRFFSRCARQFRFGRGDRRGGRAIRSGLVHDDVFLKESDLGASVTEVAVNGACGAAIVAGPTHDVNATSLVTFDADHGTAYTTASNAVLSTAGFELSGLSWRGDTLFVGDRRAGAGGKYTIHVFDRSGACTLTERAIRFSSHKSR